MDRIELPEFLGYDLDTGIQLFASCTCQSNTCEWEYQGCDACLYNCQTSCETGCQSCYTSQGCSSACQRGICQTSCQSVCQDGCQSACMYGENCSSNCLYYSQAGDSFAWTTPIEQGEPMLLYSGMSAPVTATEWNMLVGYVNRLCSKSISSVLRGYPVTEEQVTEVANALGVSVPKKITAAFFIALEAAVNALL